MLRDVEDRPVSTSIQMIDERTIFDEPHHQSLEFLAARALVETSFGTAFKFADRRCRILPAPGPHSYLLRGEACYHLGAKTAAIADVAKALEIAPDDVAANRRMLAWARGAQQLRAAFAIIQHDDNLESVRAAAHILRKNGRRMFAKLNIFEDTVEGWAVWHRDAPLEVSITGGVAEITDGFECGCFPPAWRLRFRDQLSHSPAEVNNPPDVDALNIRESFSFRPGGWKRTLAQAAGCLATA